MNQNSPKIYNRNLNFTTFTAQKESRYAMSAFTDYFVNNRENSEERAAMIIHSCPELLERIQQVGFLPLRMFWTDAQDSFRLAPGEILKNCLNALENW